MHLGLQLIVSAFGGRSPSVPEDKPGDKATRRASLLTSDEQALYKKIVDGLFGECSQVRKVHQGTPIYAVIFRQSESWDTVEKIFAAITGSDYTVNLFVERWQSKFRELRGLQKEIHDLATLILKLQRPNDRDDPKDDLLKDPDSRATTIACYKSTISLKKERIVRILDAAKDDLNSDSRNRTLLVTEKAAAALNFLNENWPLLTVFAEWAEVPMDAKRLFVRVCHPRDPEVDEEQFLNLSTKAIFTIEEIDVERREGDSDEYDEVLMRTKEIGLKRQCMGIFRDPSDDLLPRLS